MTIGENIQKHRKELGWSQDELARKLGVSISTIGMIETDKRNVKDSIKFQLCSLFNISISELMGTNEINFSKLKNTIISIFIQNNTSQTDFEKIKQEATAIIYNISHTKTNRQLECCDETTDIINAIFSFIDGIRSSINIDIEEYKKGIIETINSIVYEDLAFNSFLNVFSQLPTKIEQIILKNPFEEHEKYIAIKIECDKMIPKYEKGNIVIVQKSDILTNGQDVCFKNKSMYDIGRIYIDNNTVAIKYFNTNYDIQFFELEKFKKIYIGFVFSTRLYN